jgi:hypothetical protein
LNFGVRAAFAISAFFATSVVYLLTLPVRCARLAGPLSSSTFSPIRSP